MALKFKCDNCGTEIITKYLSVGEQAKCWGCGARVLVPATATVTDKEPEIEKYRDRPRYTKADEDEVHKRNEADIKVLLSWLGLWGGDRAGAHLILAVIFGVVGALFMLYGRPWSVILGFLLLLGAFVRIIAFFYCVITKKTL